MSLVSLTYEELVRLLKLFTYTSVLIGVLFALVNVAIFGTDLIWAGVRGLVAGIAIVAIALRVVSRMAWTSPRLARWLRKPSVNGLWRGALHTSYRSSDGQVMAPIPIAFVIKQTYFTLSIQSYTPKQTAESIMEHLSESPKTTDAKLGYAFEMKRWADAENKITIGYGLLTLVDDGTRLVGEYWTSSPTQGRLELDLVRRDCRTINSFQAAELAQKVL